MKNLLSKNPLSKDDVRSEKYKKLFQENEAEANLIISKLMIVLAATYFIIGTVNIFGLLFHYSTKFWISCFVCGSVIALISIPFAKWKKHSVKWMKYVSVFFITFTVLVINVMIGYKLWLLYAVPILLSIRYYNRLFTTIVAIYAELMAIISAFTNAYLAPYIGLIDLNLVSFNEPGQLSYTSWLYNAVIDHGFETGTVITNGFRLSVLPTCIVIIIITLISVKLIDNAKSILIKASEAHERELQLFKSAMVDSMTGMLNRRSYDEDRLKLHPETMENLTFAMFDCNGLKRTNDTVGHSAGDELIIGAAQCIQRAFAPYGKVYRWGGDEFVAVLSVSPEKLEIIKNEFLRDIAERANKTHCSLSISVGYVSASEMPEGSTITDMEALADKRMYEIKKAFYSEEKYDRRRR